MIIGRSESKAIIVKWPSSYPILGVAELLLTRGALLLGPAELVEGQGVKTSLILVGQSPKRCSLTTNSLTILRFP